MREELFCTFPDCECPITARGCMRYEDEEQKRYVDAYAKAKQRQRPTVDYATFAVVGTLAGAIIFLILTMTGALPSDMNYCRPYADQFTKKFQQYTWNRAYWTCLQSYGDPVVPKDWKSATDIVNGDEVDYTGLVGETPATGTGSAEDPAKPNDVRPLERSLTPTEQKTAWIEACAREYKTWDPKTETVVRSKRSRRVTCPCGTGVVCK